MEVEAEPSAQVGGWVETWLVVVGRVTWVCPRVEVVTGEAGVGRRCPGSARQRPGCRCTCKGQYPCKGQCQCPCIRMIAGRLLLVQLVPLTAAALQ
jgi:hypothetical protein